MHDKLIFKLAMTNLAIKSTKIFMRKMRVTISSMAMCAIVSLARKETCKGRWIDQSHNSVPLVKVRG